MRIVKSPSGSLRAERAGVTRQHIAGAARRLFGSRGYGATTLRDIATEAGVAVQTVYAVFGSKANILRTLREAVAHDPAADAAFAEAMAASSFDEATARFAHSIRLRWEAGHDIVAIHVDAASADRDVRDEVEAILGVRRAGIARLAESLERKGFVADGRRAAAAMDAVSLAQVFEGLVGVHGWSVDEYEAWLVVALRRLVDRRA